MRFSKKLGKLKKNKLLLILLIVSFLLVIGSIVFYNLSFIEVKLLGIDFEVVEGPKIGFNTDSDALHFGKISRGGTSRRSVIISNNYEFPVFASIKISGNVSPYAYVSENNFILNSGEEKVVLYYVAPKEDTPFGKYLGETRVMFTKKNLMNE